MVMRRLVRRVFRAWRWGRMVERRVVVGGRVLTEDF